MCDCEERGVAHGNQHFLYLISDGYLTRPDKLDITMGHSTMPLVCLEKKNGHPLYTRSTHQRRRSRSRARRYRMKLLIGPVDTDELDEIVRQWQHGPRGLLSRMMWGIRLAVLRDWEYGVDELDKPTINDLFPLLPISWYNEQCTKSYGAIYSQLLRSLHPR
jgi:hypothetical protein